MNMIELNNVSKNFRKKKIIKNVSFNIPKGLIIAFLGVNGAGKSTIMNMIIKVLRPTQGEINYHAKRIGIVFQENTLDDELTIYENLILRGKLYGLKKERLKENIKNLTKELKMEKFLNKLYKNCSGGEKRISMIARSLIIDPDILILDEATNALDVSIRNKLWDIFTNLNKSKKLTIFFSSHYLEEANYANYICILDHGKVIFEGDYNKLKEVNNYQKLMIKTTNNKYYLDIKNSKDALTYLNKLDITNLKEFSLTHPKLEDMFLKILGENK